MLTRCNSPPAGPGRSFKDSPYDLSGIRMVIVDCSNGVFLVQAWNTSCRQPFARVLPLTIVRTNKSDCRQKLPRPYARASPVVSRALDWCSQCFTQPP